MIFIKKILLIIMCLFLSGCYNHMELNKMAMVSLIGVDYSDDKYNVIVEIRENKKENENASLIYKGSGDSLIGALKNISFSVNKALYFIDLDTVVLSEVAANSKLDFIMDYLTRENNVGVNFNIVIDNDIEKTIEIVKKKEKIVGNYIKDIIESEFNNTINIKFNDFLENYISGYYNIILPKISDDKTDIKVSEAVIFSKEKMVNEINIQMIQIYNMINGDNKLTLFPVNYEDKEFVFKVINSSSDITYEDDKFKINLKILGIFNETEALNLNNKENVKKIISLVKDKIKEDTKEFITILIDNNADVLGFKKKYYNAKRDKINDIKDINYEVNVQVKLDRKGLIFGPIGEEHEKNN